jgi:putative transposase
MDANRPRRRAYNEPGHAHELTFSCYRGFKFLAAERTCLWLVEAIERARTDLDFALWSYVFMPEHVHLIVCPHRPDHDMAAILRAIKEPVGRRAAFHLARHAPEWLPRITEHRGRRTERHFWQPGGGFDRNVTEPRTLASMIDYIHFNPVRRGLVPQARDWQWSSAAWFEEQVGSVLVPDRIPPEWAMGDHS